MDTKPNSAAAKEQFIKMPRGLMSSDAWLSMRAGHLKIISAICEEHMRKGGKENGNLKATHRQLAALGIWPGDVARLIRDLEEWGLIECQRGGMRTPIRYALTWLPRAGGRPPNNVWQAYRTPENQKSARENEGSPARENEGREPNLHGKTKADWPKSLHGKTKALSRGTLPRKDEGDVGGSAPSAAVVPLQPAAVGGQR
jgi:hypothetical protein